VPALTWRPHGPDAVPRNRVPDHVPNPANLVPPYPSEPHEASLNPAVNKRERANHNPRVGGSSPSSGIREAPHRQRSGHAWFRDGAYVPALVTATPVGGLIAVKMWDDVHGKRSSSRPGPVVWPLCRAGREG
jgi:hypothetical protein